MNKTIKKAIKKPSLIVLIIITIILSSFGILMISETWHFHQKAFRYDEMGRQAEDPQEQQLWIIGATGARAEATMYSAIATTCFAIASLILAWAAIIKTYYRKSFST